MFACPMSWTATASESEAPPGQASSSAVVATVDEVRAASAAFAVDPVSLQARIESRLTPPRYIAGQPVESKQLRTRMEELDVPGLSVAYFENGSVKWRKGYGTTQRTDGRMVDPDTLFQAASISKPLAAMLVMLEVEKGRLHLDDDLSPRLPDHLRQSIGLTGNAPIRLEDVLSHQGGLNLPGFGGYPQDAAYPTTEDILLGRAPANNSPLVRNAAGLGRGAYSGGGYMLLQYVLESLDGRALHAQLEAGILRPAGMIRSGYFMARERGTPPDDNWASGHDAAGEVLDGKFVRYPETAAAGLWSTPSELALVAIQMQQSIRGKHGLLSETSARNMLTRRNGPWGLGWEFMSLDSEARSFQHTGSNRGYKSVLYARLDRDEGVAIMTNGDNGGELMYEVLTTIALERGWEELRPSPVSRSSVPRSSLAGLAGTYAFSSPIDGTIVVRVQGEALTIEVPGHNRETEFLPRSPDVFEEIAGSVATFHRAGDGQALTVSLGDVIARRVPDPAGSVQD